MKLDDLTCSFEQAKKLQELGVLQESILYLIPRLLPSDTDPSGAAVLKCKSGFFRYLDNSGEFEIHSSSKYYSGFTVTELGLMLPPGCQSFYNDHLGGWECEYITHHDEEKEPDIQPYPVPGFKRVHEVDDAETEAEARAEMLIYLIEQKIISVDEINKIIAE